MRNRITATILLFLSVAIPAQARTELPELGDPSLQGISTKSERELGKAFYQTLRARLDFIDDIQLNHYLRSLGQRMATHSESMPSRFKFFIINADTINAFAGPDAYIGVHSELILASENESQLASVLAHEIAHVSQRHIARMIDDSSNSAALSFATVLAAVLLASQDPQAAQAALLTGIASSQQRSINFTRQNEYEADRVGIGIMRSAGMDPAGMVEFFEILLDRGQGLQIEYLRTHPLNVNRVSEAKHRLTDDDPERSSDSLEFRFAKARLTVLTDKDPEQFESSSDDDVSNYQRGLYLIRTHRAEEAVRLLATTDDSARHPWVKLALAEALRAAGDDAEAIDLLQNLSDIYPGYLPVTLALAEARLDHRKNIDEVIRSLKHQLHTTSESQVYRVLARAYHLNGQTAAALEATGNQYLLQGYLELAIQQYENALNQNQISESDRNRLQKKIEILRGR